MNQQVTNRTRNTIKSTLLGILGFIVTYISSFALRTVFILYLGKTYLGIQGLFTNILGLLSLSELGLGSAIMFSLYEPLAKNDTNKVKALLKFYRKAYLVIGAVVLVFGLSIMPFLYLFIHESSSVPENIYFIYILFLLNSVLSYILIYKQALIKADQKTHVVSIYTNLFSILRNIFQILVILYLKSFVGVIVLMVFFTVLGNLSLSIKTNKLYPWIIDLKNHSLKIDEKKDIFSKIKAMFLYRIGAYIVTGTDNILISSFIGIDQVGIYSNYLMIISLVKSLTGFFTVAVTPSIGNLISSVPIKRVKKIFHEIDFMIFWIYSLCSLLILFLINPFITLWLGSDYVLNFNIVIILVINFYMYGIHQTMLIYRNALGLYEKAKLKPIFEAIINLVASLLLVNYLGLLGIFLGTTISFISTALWIEPYILYKEYFKESSLEYFFNYIKYCSITIASAFILWIFISNLHFSILMNIIISFFFILLIHNFVVYLLFHRSEKFKDFTNRLRRVVNMVAYRREV